MDRHTTWTEEAALLRQRQPDILSPAFPGTLEVLEDLHPAHPGLARVRSRLDLITSESFDHALAGLDSADQSYPAGVRLDRDQDLG